MVEHIDLLREAVRKVKAMHSFEIDAMVILPGHLPADERRSRSRLAKGERGIWQRRYWEHLIRDDRDYAHHVDYYHYNPVKHGYVQRAADWPHSTFHREVERGAYPLDWVGTTHAATYAPKPPRKTT